MNQRPTHRCPLQDLHYMLQTCCTEFAWPAKQLPRRVPDSKEAETAAHKAHPWGMITASSIRIK